MQRLALVGMLVWLAGCRQLLGVDDPTVGTVADAPDAELDAIDANAVIDTPSGCSTAGLICPNAGTATMVGACGGDNECFVGCTNGGNFTHGEAVAACTAWGGRLTSIYSVSEETCIRATIDGGIWIGLEQLAGQPSPGAGWSWNGDDEPPVYLNWAGGQPNDTNGIEDGQEQCAYSAATSMTWQDISCATSLLSRLVCRRP